MKGPSSLAFEQVMRRLCSDPGFPRVLAGLIGEDRKILHDLASALHELGDTDLSLDIYAQIRYAAPDDIPATLNAARLLSEGGRIEQALELLLAARGQGAVGGEIAAAIQRQLFDAAEAHGRCVNAGELDRALTICELLIALCPDVTLFRRARLETLVMQQRQHERLAEEASWSHYRELCDLAAECQGRRELEMEQQCRVDIARHPIDRQYHSIARVTNIAHALSRILSVDVPVFDADRVALAKELLTTLAAIPTTPVDPLDAPAQAAAAWERTIRFLLRTIDPDAIFAKPVESSPIWPMTFVDSGGIELSMTALAARSDELDAKVLFLTSASAEYFERHARTYLSSVLASCDCECLVFICLSAPKSRLADLVRAVGIHDRRVIYGCDDRDPKARPWQVHKLGGGAPFDFPGIYFATCGLLHMDVLLQTLERPIFVTGIDTVLQRGVSDLLADSADADIVFNKMGAHLLLGGQIVNNLILVYPTANAVLLLQFMKSYHGDHVSQTEQPEFQDQLDLHMAKLHLMTHGNRPNISYFGPLDINNDMFNRDNFRTYFEQMRSYRFLNMFVSGCPANALVPEDVEIAATSPTLETMSLALCDS
jgi:hypothetical protein